MAYLLSDRVLAGNACADENFAAGSNRDAGQRWEKRRDSLSQHQVLSGIVSGMMCFPSLR